MNATELYYWESIIFSAIALLYFAFFLVVLVKQFYFPRDVRNRRISNFIRHWTLFFVISYMISFLFFIVIYVHELGIESESHSELAYLSSQEYYWVTIGRNLLWLMSRVSFYLLFLGRLYYTFRRSAFRSGRLTFILLYTALALEFTLLIFINIFIFAVDILDTSSSEKNAHAYQILVLTVGFAIFLIDLGLSLTIMLLFIHKLFLLIMSRTQDLVTGKIDPRRYSRELDKSAMSLNEFSSYHKASPSSGSASIKKHGREQVRTIADTPKHVASYASIQSPSVRFTPAFGASSSASAAPLKALESPHAMNPLPRAHNSQNSETSDFGETNGPNPPNTASYVLSGSEVKTARFGALSSVRESMELSQDSVPSQQLQLINSPSVGSETSLNEVEMAQTGAHSTKLVNSYNSGDMEVHADQLQLSLLSGGSASTRGSMRTLWHAFNSSLHSNNSSEHGLDGTEAPPKRKMGGKEGKRAKGGKSGHHGLQAKLDHREVILINTVAQQTLLSSVAMVSSSIYLLSFLVSNWDIFAGLTFMPHFVTIYREVDRMIAMACVYLGFRFAKKYYKICCGRQHKCCKVCCEKIAKKRIEKKYVKMHGQYELLVDG